MRRHASAMSSGRTGGLRWRHRCRRRRRLRDRCAAEAGFGFSAVSGGSVSRWTTLPRSLPALPFGLGAAYVTVQFGLKAHTVMWRIWSFCIT